MRDHTRRPTELSVSVTVTERSPPAARVKASASLRPPRSSAAALRARRGLPVAAGVTIVAIAGACFDDVDTVIEVSLGYEVLGCAGLATLACSHASIVLRDARDGDNMAILALCWTSILLRPLQPAPAARRRRARRQAARGRRPDEGDRGVRRRRAAHPLDRERLPARHGHRGPGGARARRRPVRAHRAAHPAAWPQADGARRSACGHGSRARPGPRGAPPSVRRASRRSRRGRSPPIPRGVAPPRRPG